MKKVIFLVLLVISGSSVSRELDNIAITKLMFDNIYGNKLYIETTEGWAEVGCHKSSWSFVLDIPANSELHRNMYSMLLAAKASGATLKLVGKATCDDHNFIESLRRVELK